MVQFGARWRVPKSIVIIVFLKYFLAFFAFVSAERRTKHEASTLNATKQSSPDYLLKAAIEFLWQPDQPAYQHVWPVSLKYIHTTPTLKLPLFPDCLIPIICKKKKNQFVFINLLVGM